MTLYANIDADGWLLSECGRPDADDMVGPPAPPGLDPAAGTSLRQLAAPVLRNRPSPTVRARWLDTPAPVWVETATLDEIKAAAIAATYADVDKVHFDAVGNRATEYQDAETAARAFSAGGFQGAADDDVHSYAIDNTTGEVQTDQWAAENIIARADAFRAAQKAMRNTRFKRQSEMRAAVTPEDLMTVVAAWDGFIAGLRAQLGL